MGCSTGNHYPGRREAIIKNKELRESRTNENDEKEISNYERT